MSNYTCLVLIFISVIALIITLVFFYIANEKIKISKIELYNNINFTEKESILDKIIDDAFTSYKLNNPDLYSGDNYITQENVMKMIKVITTKSFLKITPAIKSNLSLIYNIDKDDQLIDIIGEKTSLVVMAFVSQKNASL